MTDLGSRYRKARLLGLRGKMLAETLGTWLADVKLSADSTDRRDPFCR